MKKENRNPSVSFDLCSKLIIHLRKHLALSCYTACISVCTRLNINMCVY